MILGWWWEVLGFFVCGAVALAFFAVIAWAMIVDYQRNYGRPRKGRSSWGGGF